MRKFQPGEIVKVRVSCDVNCYHWVEGVIDFKKPRETSTINGTTYLNVWHFQREDWEMNWASDTKDWVRKVHPTRIVTPAYFGAGYGDEDEQEEDDETMSKRVPEAQWYVVMNDRNEVHATAFGPGKKEAQRLLRNFRRQQSCDGPYHLVPDEDVPKDANWYANWYPD